MNKIFCQRCGKELICLTQKRKTIDNRKEFIFNFACDDCNIDYKVIENKEQTKKGENK